MPRHSRRSRVKCDYSSRFDSAAAQQQIQRAGTSVVRLRRRDREHMPPHLWLLQPARNQTLEDARPALPKSPPGDDEHATPSRGARCSNKGTEGPMRLCLSHSVKIKARLDLAQTTLQPLGVGPVDPGKPIKR